MYRLPKHRAGVFGPQTWAHDDRPLPEHIARVVAMDCAGLIVETIASRDDGKLIVWCGCGYPIPVCEHERFVAHIERGEIVSTECLDCDLVMPEQVTR